MLQLTQRSKTRLRAAISISHTMDRQTTSLRCKIVTPGHIGYEGQRLLVSRMSPIYFPERGNASPQTISVNLQDRTSDSVSPSSVTIQFADIAAVHCYALTKDEGITVSKPSSEQTNKLRSRKKQLEEWRLLDIRLTSVASVLIPLSQTQRG